MNLSTAIPFGIGFRRWLSCCLFLGGFHLIVPTWAIDITLAARKDIVVTPPPKDEILVPEQYRGIHRVTPNQYSETSWDELPDESYDADFTKQFRGGFLRGWEDFLRRFQEGDFDLDETTDTLRSSDEFVGAFSINAPNAFIPGQRAGTLACRDALLALTQKRNLTFQPVRTLLAKKLLALGASGPGLNEDGNLIQIRSIRGSNGRKIQNEDLIVLREVSLANVKSLSLPETMLTDAGFMNLPPMPQLTNLEIGGTNLTGACLQALNKFPHLVGLSLVGPLTVKTGDLKEIPKLPDLEGISLRKVEIEDDAIRLFQSLPRLTTLHLEWAYEGSSRAKLGAGAIAKLSGCKRLKGLSLRGYAVDNTALNEIAMGLPELLSLSLVNTDITDESIGSIQKLTKLDWLDLSQTRVTDAGIAALASHPSITTIWLIQAQTSDRALALLVTLPKLREIFIHRRQISLAAMVAFKKLRPDVHITEYN